MTSRRTALSFALLLLAVVVLALLAQTADGREQRAPGGARSDQVVSARPARTLTAAAAIRQEFGTGPLAGCMFRLAWRESRMQPRAHNWGDRHADGSTGSHGLMQLGSLWRRPGETVAAFARRMENPAENVKLAHRIYRLHGLAPWGGSCG